MTQAYPGSEDRPRLVVVAHDAGGAEIVSSWLRHHHGEWDTELVLGGPAVNVFTRKLGDDTVAHAELPPLQDVAFVLCGSSGAASLERRAVRGARSAGVRCAVWLDHWINYPMRFELDGELVFPDEVWVCDEHAAALARAELPGADVRVMGNPYLEDFAADVAELEAAIRPGRASVAHILYVTEPVTAAARRATGDPHGWGYTEHEALDHYLRHLAENGPGQVQVRVRMHPAEPAGKYDSVLAQHAAAIELSVSSGATLAQDVAWADTVVGCDTMAMIAALEVGRRVISVLPAGARSPSLPHPEIERPLHE